MWNIINTKGQWLMHDGCMHVWTGEKRYAMDYTKVSVAEALALKYGGRVVTA